MAYPGDYLRRNLWAGLKTPPRDIPPWLWLLIAGYAVAAVGLGLGIGLLEFGLLDDRRAAILPFTLLVFPSLLEEALFRGLVIPRDVLARGRGTAAAYAVLSTTLFVSWHPLNAATINPGAAGLFFDPGFLAITALLGITCAVAYIRTRSLWAPILIHWTTVVAWVLFLGGRNLLLEA
ncbi:MAG: CPBP family glutamic-type intramembrane protease [Gammaproteobacteria bacterium]|nr:CPBP family glutamic-type intramembrane protease [Gammaproteobacteria bacterium]